MTENKTGDFAQNLPVSQLVQPAPHLTKITSESAFKSTNQRNVALVDEQKIQEKSIPQNVSRSVINAPQISTFTNFTPTLVKNMVNINEYKGSKESLVATQANIAAIVKNETRSSQRSFFLKSSGLPLTNQSQSDVSLLSPKELIFTNV